MKLVTLQIVPDKDQSTVIVTIDHAPSEFKSCYVTVTYGRDGTYHLISIPPHIEEDVLKQAKSYAQIIINTAIAFLEPFFELTPQKLEKIINRISL